MPVASASNFWAEFVEIGVFVGLNFQGIYKDAVVKVAQYRLGDDFLQITSEFNAASTCNLVQWLATSL